MAYDQTAADLLRELKAAKQRELELLAVIENQRTIMRISSGICTCLKTSPDYNDHEDYCHYKLTQIAIRLEPSQALREHEAKVIEEIAKDFKYEWNGDSDTYVEHQVDNETYEHLMSVAEERRKK